VKFKSEDGFSKWNDCIGFKLKSLDITNVNKKFSKADRKVELIVHYAS